jgi:hypothetical protein
VLCPIDGQLGAAYVHCLGGKDEVGDANFMLSYSWGCVFSFRIDAFIFSALIYTNLMFSYTNANV